MLSLKLHTNMLFHTLKQSFYFLYVQTIGNSEVHPISVELLQCASGGHYSSINILQCKAAVMTTTITITDNSGQ